MEALIIKKKNTGVYRGPLKKSHLVTLSIAEGTRKC